MIRVAGMKTHITQPFDPKHSDQLISLVYALCNASLPVYYRLYKLFCEVINARVIYVLCLSCFGVCSLLPVVT